ncbi:BON domain-containing protein [Paraburkholderia diazotrophica]|uniref:Osmotically-inducible protein OsmY, contains BON domain n=1 Tax=Paraburkholderia diazotrophica TaxID=667676 RepID=A0A1H7ECV4_9BURK|nr:BON domain-containing protein [Paraburkholderia diazotrophica]SEK10877.1 Osmotically-inducible protein OsmY, contains BON domain [Paraburkholderia diazotrophica]
MKTDRQLKNEVEAELDWDPAVTSTDIGVEVTDHVVTLSGHPPSFAEKLAAEKAAHRVAGVKAVVVEMQVHLPQKDERTDEEIANAVHAILHWTVGLPEDSVKVQVEKGWITLRGTVDWAYQSHVAARAVSHMRGVRGVLNRIEVRGKIASEDIGEKIAQAMQRHAEREVKHIGIHVKDGMVTLTGKVGSYAERAVARGAAWSAPGVLAVVDDLVVE